MSVTGTMNEASDSSWKIIVVNVKDEAPSFYVSFTNSHKQLPSVVSH